MINVFKPSLGEEELESLREIFETGWIGLGPRTKEFEEKFAEYVGSKYAFALNSATSALHLACVLAELKPGDEVLVPTITFASTALAVKYCGATPVFVDVNSDDLNIDVNDLRKKLTWKSKVIIPVHYGGYPCDMDEIWKIANGRIVFEDAAHACGSEYRGKKIGGLKCSDLTTFSFHAVKNLTTGDGGMITTNNDEVAKRLPGLRWCGIDKSTWDRSEDSQYSWYYSINSLGYKYHMNDIAASIGLVQLRKLDKLNNRRREIVSAYNTELSVLEPRLVLPQEKPDTTSSMHNYVVQLDERDKLHLHLKELKISTGVHYIPLHKQPIFSDNDSHCPVADEVWKRILTLPLYPDMTDSEVEYVIDGVKDFFK